MGLSLNEQEKAYLKALIDRGEPLPPKYKAMLFADASEVELVWPGKTRDVTNVVLPFQSIEQIDEPRLEQSAEQLDFLVDSFTGRQRGGWTNKLIWGDNKLVLSSLKNGPLRREIEAAGGLKLVYIDPPFDVGADFSFSVNIGDEELLKEPSIIEEIAYRDTWGRDVESYISMMYERIVLIHDILNPEASIFVHADWRVQAYLRLILDEVFGRGGANDRSGFRNEIIWYHNVIGTGKKAFPKSHETILWYSKGTNWTVNAEVREARVPYSDRITQTLKQDEDGRYYYVRGNRDSSGGNTGKWFRTYVDPEEIEMGKFAADVWDDIKSYRAQGEQQTGYQTQKPEKLLERIIAVGSNPDDLVGDFFCGSGTTMAVGEKMGRKWIGCDLGRYAIHTARKRLIGVQRELKSQKKPYRSFEILNLGKYERQYWVGMDPTLPETERNQQTLRKEEDYLTLILQAYKAERLFQLPPFHGRKGQALVVVGPVDAPVTREQVMEIVAACRQHRVSRVDVLGFEFEMGLVPYVRDEVQAQGVNMSLKYIPKDVFDRRAVERGQVTFYDVAYVEVGTQTKGLSVTVTLKDFAVYYQQDDVNVLAEQLKNGVSKVTVESGQVVKVTKDKGGRVTQEVLTQKWSDWVDYWAVDFDFERRPEIIRIVEADGTERDVRTGNYLFENEWQSFRTRKDRTLELTSAPHTYLQAGRYKIAVKVIDIFGIDTTKVVEVVVP